MMLVHFVYFHLPNAELSGNRRRRVERMLAFAHISAGKAAAPKGLPVSNDLFAPLGATRS